MSGEKKVKRSKLSVREKFFVANLRSSNYDTSEAARKTGLIEGTARDMLKRPRVKLAVQRELVKIIKDPQGVMEHMAEFASRPWAPDKEHKINQTRINALKSLADMMGLGAPAVSITFGTVLRELSDTTLAEIEEALVRKGGKPLLVDVEEEDPLADPGPREVATVIPKEAVQVVKIGDDPLDMRDRIDQKPGKSPRRRDQ